LGKGGTAPSIPKPGIRRKRTVSVTCQTSYRRTPVSVDSISLVSVIRSLPRSEKYV